MKQPNIAMALAATAAVALVGVQASAQVVTGYTGGTVFATFQADGDTVGWRFSVDRPIIITHLGFWDGDSVTAPMTLSHEVGLWDDVGTLITSNTVTAASPFTGLWRYEPTANMTIGPGTYRVGAFYSATNPLADGYITGTSGITMSPGFTMISTLRDADGPQTGLVFPTIETAPGGRFGPNFQFTEVPEPATFVGLATLGVLVLLRRRR